MVARTTIAVAPTLPASAKLTRFHGDATETPLYTIVTWTSRHGRAGAAGAAPIARKRQLALENASHRLLEVQRVGAAKDKNRSWFVGNHVQQDGSMVMLTPMDPLFVLLHAVVDQKDRYLSTYDLLACDQNTWWLQLGPALTQAKIEQICDVQYTGDDAIDNLYVRVSESKTLAWLAAKVERVATVLAKRAESASSTGAFDTKFALPGQAAPKTETPTANDATLTPEQIKRCHGDAIDIIADYLPPSLVPALLKHLNVSTTTPASTTVAANALTNAAVVAEPIDAIRRFDRRTSLEPENTTPAKRTGAASAAASSAKKKSKLANVDRTGMKSISSFFGKK